MLADQLEAPALLETRDEGSMDQTGNVEKGFERDFEVIQQDLGIALKNRLKEEEYKDDAQVFGWIKQEGLWCH